ncbi:MAG: chemotaxis protein CheD [Candidatus Heimdallarchaeota archaeon]|nr:chemotaxis protein CheD [Candidatus Heimdallarchaeota archaeon]
MYEEDRKVAALAHVALPEKLPEARTVSIKSFKLIGRYADTAVPELIKLLISMGAKKSRMKAKLAGGSNMFGTKQLLGLGLNIGQRNVEAVTELLNLSNIDIVSKDVLGNVSRTVSFEVETQIYSIKRGYESNTKEI